MRGEGQEAVINVLNKQTAPVSLEVSKLESKAFFIILQCHPSSSLNGTNTTHFQRLQWEEYFTLFLN